MRLNKFAMPFRESREEAKQNDCGRDWKYATDVPEGDCRKLVTLLHQGMVWVGIRAWNHTEKQWMNNNEFEMADVLAWQNLPQPAEGRWSLPVRGGRTLQGAEQPPTTAEPKDTADGTTLP